MVSRYVRQGTNRKKPWEHAKTRQIWKGSRTRQGRLSARPLAPLFVESHLVLDVENGRTQIIFKRLTPFGVDKSVKANKTTPIYRL